MVAFGAAAKACTLINELGIASQIAYCVDDTPQKQFRYMPGTNIQIRRPLQVFGMRRCCCAAWNFESVIRERIPNALVNPFRSDCLSLVRGRGAKPTPARYRRLKIPFWQATTDWHLYVPNGVIVATPPESHFGIAKRLSRARSSGPARETDNAQALQTLTSWWRWVGSSLQDIHVFYSPAWREFKASLAESWRRLRRGRAEPREIPWWDWGPHLVAMSHRLRAVRCP
jgi:hypothetical protein